MWFIRCLQHRRSKSRRDGIIVANKMPILDQNPIGVADSSGIFMSPFQGFKSGLCAFSVIMPSLRDCLLPVGTLWIRMISDVVYRLFAISPFKIPKGWSYRSKQNAYPPPKPHRGGRLIGNTFAIGFRRRPRQSSVIRNAIPCII
jgi:hypothetical protein